MAICTYSQGGVKFPTGGIKVRPLSPRALASFYREAGTSRSGEMPEPTVKVRMEENAMYQARRHRCGGCFVIALGGLLMPKGDYT